MTIHAPRGTRTVHAVGRRARSVLSACVLSGMMAGCHSWAPVSPAALPPELLHEARSGASELHDVRITSTSATPSESLVVPAYVCQVDTSIVLSAPGDSSRAVQAWLSALRPAESSRLAVRETGCECAPRPCMHLDVSNALVEIRIVADRNAGKITGIVLASLLGAGVVFGLSYLFLRATWGAGN